MSVKNEDVTSPQENRERPAAETGNASNPAPFDDSLEPGGSSQLLGKGAEKYLREVASIEDLPDAHDQQAMDEVLDDEGDK